MAGVRRRLRDVGTRVSGVLNALRDEVAPGAEPEDDQPAEQPAEQSSEQSSEQSVQRSPGLAPAEEQPGKEPPGSAAIQQQPAGAPVGDTETVPDETTLTAEPGPTGAEPAVAALGDAAPSEVEQLAERDQPAVEQPTAPLEPDALCAAAVALARAAAVEEAGSVVGEHLGVSADDVTVATHSFATTDPAYVGWHWAVTVARAEGSDTVTVDEVVLLPGAGALLAPSWVPYSDRVLPDDLSPGDLLPPAPDDVRLVPAYADPDGLVEDLFWELGLGRPRVLSREGRAEAAERWYTGDAGPDSARAKAAPGRCGDCGFLVPLAGALRAGFGACANGQAPDDGRVVALDHGCGAHSETPVELTHVAGSGMAVEEEFDVEHRVAEPAVTAAEEEFDVEHRVAEPAVTAAEEAFDGDAGGESGAEHAAATAGPDRPDGDSAADGPVGPDGAAPQADPLPGPAEEEQAEQLGHS